MRLTNILFPVFIRLSTSRPLGERSEPSLAAKRPTARGRLRTFLRVFMFAYIFHCRLFSP